MDQENHLNDDDGWMDGLMKRILNDGHGWMKRILK